MIVRVIRLGAQRFTHRAGEQTVSVRHRTQYALDPGEEVCDDDQLDEPLAIAADLP